MTTIEKEPKAKESKAKELLPKKPSVLLKLALKDLETCRNSPKYTIDMDYWFYTNGNECTVCLAGAVMAQTLGFDPMESPSCGPYTHPKISDTTRKKLLALNNFRMGNILTGLNRLGCKLPKDFPAVIKIVPYERSPDEFLICINKLIENFEKVDL